jgi:hypothetical protein
MAQPAGVDEKHILKYLGLKARSAQRAAAIAPHAAPRRYAWRRQFCLYYNIGMNHLAILAEFLAPIPSGGGGDDASEVERLAM